MTDEVSESMRVSFTVWCTAGLVAAALGVTIMSISVFNNYTSNYTNAMTSSATNNLSDLAKLEAVTCPTVYSALVGGIDRINTIVYKVGSNSRQIYKLGTTSEDDLITLMTGSYTTKYVRVTMTPNNKNGLLDVVLEEVTR